MNEDGEYLALVFHANLVTLIGSLANQGDAENIAGESLSRKVDSLALIDSIIGLRIIANVSYRIGAIELILIHLRERGLGPASRGQTHPD